MSDRRGFALITVMFLMAAGSALMLVTVNASIADSETARTSTIRRRALGASESGAWTTLYALDAAALRGAPIGTRIVSATTDVNTSVTTTVEKVDTTIVWIVSTATIHQAGTVGQHRVGLSVLIPRDTMDQVLHTVPERAWAELF